MKNFLLPEIKKAFGGKVKYRYRCQCCGDVVYCSAPCGPSDTAALSKEQEKARQRFNRCCICGRWVCDSDFDKDTFVCGACIKLGHLSIEDIM